MEVKPGSRWRSAVDDTEVIVVRTPGGDIDLRCGGAEMIAQSEARPSDGAPADGLAEGTLLGKRYADEGLGIELLCTKAGAGTLSVGDTVLARKDAKPLPASD
jgi:hypothetical protein